MKSLGMLATRLLLIGCVIFTAAPPLTTLAQEITTTFNDGITTVKMSPLKISGEKDHYYSLHVAPSFRYEGEQPRTPEFITFELQTVVKSRQLNPDLYVLFVIDGEKVFLSSNRWGVKSPVPGRRWVGERLAMRMPLEVFHKLVEAKDVAIRMGSTVFSLNHDHLAALARLTKMPDKNARLSQKRTSQEGSEVTAAEPQ